VEGLAKPLALAGMVGAVLVGFFHYMKVGPVEEKSDERRRSDEPRMLKRYEDGERMNHWVIALMFVLAGLSGLAFFHPSAVLLQPPVRRRAVDAHPAPLHRGADVPGLPRAVRCTCGATT
jgi:hypothetical protein